MRQKSFQDLEASHFKFLYFAVRGKTVVVESDVPFYADFMAYYRGCVVVVNSGHQKGGLLVFVECALGRTQ